MSGFTKCTLELNFGDEDILNTISTIKVNDNCLDIYELVQSVIYPALVGIGYHPELIKEVIRIED